MKLCIFTHTHTQRERESLCIKFVTTRFASTTAKIFVRLDKESLYPFRLKTIIFIIEFIDYLLLKYLFQ